MHIDSFTTANSNAAKTVQLSIESKSQKHQRLAANVPENTSLGQKHKQCSSKIRQIFRTIVNSLKNGWTRIKQLGSKVFSRKHSNQKENSSPLEDVIMITAAKDMQATSRYDAQLLESIQPQLHRNVGKQESVAAKFPLPFPVFATVPDQFNDLSRATNQKKNVQSNQSLFDLKKSGSIDFEKQSVRLHKNIKSNESHAVNFPFPVFAAVSHQFNRRSEATDRKENVIPNQSLLAPKISENIDSEKLLVRFHKSISKNESHAVNFPFSIFGAAASQLNSRSKVTNQKKNMVSNQSLIALKTPKDIGYEKKSERMHKSISEKESIAVSSLFPHPVFDTIAPEQLSSRSDGIDHKNKLMPNQTLFIHKSKDIDDSERKGFNLEMTANKPLQHDDNSFNSSPNSIKHSSKKTIKAAPKAHISADKTNSQLDAYTERMRQLITNHMLPPKINSAAENLYEINKRILHNYGRKALKKAKDDFNESPS